MPLRGLKLTRNLRLRSRYYTALLVILFSGAGLILVASRFAGLPQDVLINLGASVVGVFLVAVILEPIIERGRRPEEIIHLEFPHEHYLGGIEACSQKIRIMGAWPYMMESQWRSSFLHALERALMRGVQAQILMLDPTSKAAEQRSKDLGVEERISTLVTDILQCLADFGRTLPREASDRFEVRVYNSLPPARMYRWDNRAISSFFPMGDRWGTDVRHYETNVLSGLGSFVDEQFWVIWRDMQTRDLTDYLGLRISLLPANKKLVVKYVILDEGIYVVDTELTDYLFRHVSGDLRVRCTGVNAAGTSVETYEYIAQGVPDSDPSVLLAKAYYQRKYGTNVSKDGLPGVVRLARDVNNPEERTVN